MSFKIIIFYLIFHLLKLLRVSLNLTFVFGSMLMSFDDFVVIRTLNHNLNFFYIGPYGFDMLLFFLGHSVLFIGLFKNLNQFPHYLLFILFFYLCNFIIYKFFGNYADSPGLVSLFFYFFDLLIFWILELGLFPIALIYLKANHD